jgi:hypothetical protein
MWSRNFKNEAALARFVENDIRKLGIVGWREVGTIRMDEEGNKRGACPSWIVEPKEGEKDEYEEQRNNNNNNNNKGPYNRNTT